MIPNTAQAPWAGLHLRGVRSTNQPAGPARVPSAGLLGAQTPRSHPPQRWAGRAGITRGDTRALGGRGGLSAARGCCTNPLSNLPKRRFTPAPCAAPAEFRSPVEIPQRCQRWGLQGPGKNLPGTIQELGRRHPEQHFGRREGSCGNLGGSRGAQGNFWGHWGRGSVFPRRSPRCSPRSPALVAMGPALPSLPNLPMNAAINLERNLCVGQRKNTAARGSRAAAAAAARSGFFFFPGLAPSRDFSPLRFSQPKTRGSRRV